MPELPTLSISGKLEWKDICDKRCKSICAKRGRGEGGRHFRFRFQLFIGNSIDKTFDVNISICLKITSKADSLCGFFYRSRSDLDACNLSSSFPSPTRNTSFSSWPQFYPLRFKTKLLKGRCTVLDQESQFINILLLNRTCVSNLSFPSLKNARPIRTFYLLKLQKEQYFNMICFPN